MIHHTRVDDVAIHSSGWARLDEEWEVTALPLIDRAHALDGGENLFARLNYDEASAVAQREGAQLISGAQIETLRSVGLQLQPFLGTPRAENEIVHSERHDADVWRQLHLLGWDGAQPVAGAGKHWVIGGPEDDPTTPQDEGHSRLKGWDKDGAGPGLVWWQNETIAHNRKHFDDGTTTVLVRRRRLVGVPGNIGSAAVVATVQAGIAASAASLQPVHGWRCSVAELVVDAKATGSWRSAADVRSGVYVLQEGDLVVSARMGEEPESGGRGHVEIVSATAAGHDPTTIGGNEGDRIVCEVYRLANKDFRGIIVRGELGRRALLVAREELAAGIKETPGPGATKRIQEYHAGARRKGSPLAGMPGHETEGSAPLGERAPDEVPWCASKQSFCTYQAIVRAAA